MLDPPHTFASFTVQHLVVGRVRGRFNSLSGIKVIAANDIWAVGSYYNGSVYRTLVEHWNGGGWSVVSSPNQGNGNDLNGVAAVAAIDVWAVGRYYPNGSVQNIAGITNRRGNVLGMMPHPERCCDPLLDGTDGLLIFKSILNSCRVPSPLMGEG